MTRFASLPSRWPALLLAGAVAGCASMAPPYEVPEMPIGDFYPGLRFAGGPEGADAPSTVAWQIYFSDPRLKALIALALANNRDLRGAVARVEAARAGYGIQRAAAFPAIGLGVDAGRSRIPADLSLTGKPLLASQYQVGVGFTAWEIDFWGRIRSLKDAALESFLATDAARRAVSISLVAQVANGYLSLRELDERLVLARQTTASRAESLRIFRRRVALGATSQLDLTQVETLHEQALALGIQLELARALEANALALLVGAPVDLGPWPDRVEDAAVMGALTVGLPSALLVERPDIVAAEHQLRAANANIGAARAAFFPRIALTGSLGTASAELDGLFGAGSRAWSIAPGLLLPLFDGGRNRNTLALTEARRGEAVAAYEKAVQAAFRDTADALAARAWLGEQVHTLEATVAVQTRRAHLARLRYDNGAAAFLEVLDAQRDQLAAAQQLVQTRRALLASRVDLYVALGGGASHLAPANGDSADSPDRTPSTLPP